MGSKYMERWAGKTAVVTGVASGIGEAIALDLLRNMVNVIGLDIRSESCLSSKWKENETRGHFRYVVCDVSEPENLEDFFTLVEEDGGVDIMVNNVGVADYKRIIESDRRTFQRLLNINVLATSMCINWAVRSMRQRNVEGHIFNINSVLGHKIPSGSFLEIDGCNGWNLYPTCKHGTVALTHTVRQELAAIKAPIRITSISPGIVNTNIAEHAPQLTDILKKIPALEPEDVADALIYALGTRPEVQISELTIQHTGEP
nr:PREDICTED: dehydrogenase/reductase SDR family member 11-like [Megachile rotundata]